LEASPAAASKPGSLPKAPVEPPLLVSLAAIFESWPEALKLEISQLDLENAQVALPANLVEPALKRGRVVFAWRDLRSWIKSAAVAVSVHDNTELELPLKVLAPLFFARQKGGAAGPKKVSVTEEIPDMFFGSTLPASAPPAPVAPPPPPVPSAVAAAIPRVDTNFILRSIKPPMSDSEFLRKGGTDFKSRSAAPADIITRAMELPGVAGALITLADGLKVASQVPAELNGDTLAAFIPQIFARVTQGSRELRMGDLNNLSFTVGSVPWKIFRVNAVYFAAFGRKNEPLPGAPLAALAVELDHKK
jgi:predicted regulator of Ras-like GTPase activity (Roadblock/LC7/MglB family)